VGRGGQILRCQARLIRVIRRTANSVQPMTSAPGQKRRFNDVCVMSAHPLESGRLLDHLIGAREQRRRHVEAERFSGLKVDDQLEFCWLLDR
jgi:hypothetical protein